MAELIKKLGDGNYRVRERATQRPGQRWAAKVLADCGGHQGPGRRAGPPGGGLHHQDQRRATPSACRSGRPGSPPSGGRTGRPRPCSPTCRSPTTTTGMVAEVKSALTTLALDPNGKPDSALLKALADPVPLRRSAAAEALAKGGGLSVRADVKKLLADMDPAVRQSAAAALTVAGEKDAVPVLIDLLGELPAGQTWPAQDVLHQLAGDKAPAPVAGRETGGAEEVPRRLGRLVEGERGVRRPGQADDRPRLPGLHARGRGGEQQHRSGGRGRSRRQDPLADRQPEVPRRRHRPARRARAGHRMGRQPRGRMGLQAAT